MWVKKIFEKNNAKSMERSKNNLFISIILIAAIAVVFISTLSVFSGLEQGYSNTTNKCISCHNDTGYPTDTDEDGVAAPYKRPHNNNTMCESCHGADPHTIKFIQPDGTYGSKSTAASCPACHQTGIPSENNTNFTQAFRIPVTLSHSSDPSNGSVWGSYWNNSNPKTACFYCHNNTLHNIFPMGRILDWSPDYIINGSIGSNFTCAGCHYKGSANYSMMNSSFAAAGLQTPPEITNGTNWNGKTVKYFNHTLQGYTDNDCMTCHGNSLSPDARMSEFLHNVNYADMNNCLGCHRTGGAGPEVNDVDLGLHTNLNGTINLTSEDCRMCHYSDPHTGPNASNTYYCIDCHNATGFSGSKQAPPTLRFNANKHGVNQCVECHVADGKYHRGNPRGSVANSTYVSRYNTINTYTDCADCHYSANLDDAPFNAPGGGAHINSLGGSCSTGGGSSCHAGGSTLIQTIHKLSSKDQGNKPTVTIPTLNPQTVTKGSSVTVDTRVSISSLYEFVDGAQYRIMSGSTEIQSWTPMSAVGGNFGGSSTNATATIDTNILTPGTYSVEVRGMAGGPAQNVLIRYYPINGDISTVKSANLTVEAYTGYVNGTVRNTSGDIIQGASISIAAGNTISGQNGTYSLSVEPGMYDITASKRPIYYDNTTYGILVTELNTTIVNVTLEIKPTGTINGTVTNV